MEFTLEHSIPTHKATLPQFLQLSQSNKNEIMKMAATVIYTPLSALENISP